MKLTPCSSAEARMAARSHRVGGRFIRLMAAAVVAAAGCGRQTVAPAPGGRPQSEMAAPGSGVAPASSLTRVTPVDWKSSPWQPRAQPREWAYLVIHHTATDTGSVESIHRTHSQRRDAAGNLWQGIGYHFVIGNGQGMEDGEIEPTFRWREQLAGAHAGSATYNEKGIGICLVGNFEKHRPSSAQAASLKRLIGHLTQEYRIPPKQIVRHADVSATVCPGKLFPIQEFRQTSPSVSFQSHSWNNTGNETTQRFDARSGSAQRSTE